MTILALIKELLSELVNLVRGINSSRDKSNFRGDIMYIVKADHPEIGFNLTFKVTDSEGNIVPDDSLIVMVESDNEDAVDITVDETGKAGTVMFGNPGLANVNATVESKEGVLLLNRVLTTEVGESGSHTDIGWKKITDRIAAELGKRDLVAILWGKQAQELAPFFRLKVEGVHPSPLSAYKGFFGSRPFSRVNEILIAEGKSPIDWSL
mgnify:CR=1 FL=1